MFVSLVGLVLDRGALPKWLHTSAIGRALERGAGQGVGEEGGGGQREAGERFHRRVHLQDHQIMPTRETTESNFQPTHF